MTDPKPSLDRAGRATAAVFERAERFAAAMDAAGLPYAVGGDCAAYVHVDRAEPSAVRFPATVEAVVAADDADRIRAAAGTIDLETRILPPDGKPARGVVSLLTAGAPCGPVVVPVPGESEPGGRFRVLTLSALARTLLGRWKRNDRVSLRDFMDVGLIDDSWPARFPPPLGERLQALLDDPDG